MSSGLDLKRTAWSEVEMFGILPRDWNLKPIFTQKWASADMRVHPPPPTIPTLAMQLYTSCWCLQKTTAHLNGWPCDVATPTVWFWSTKQSTVDYARDAVLHPTTLTLSAATPTYPAISSRSAPGTETARCLWPLSTRWLSPAPRTSSPTSRSPTSVLPVSRRTIF